MAISDKQSKISQSLPYLTNLVVFYGMMGQFLFILNPERNSDVWRQHPLSHNVDKPHVSVR